MVRSWLILYKVDLDRERRERLWPILMHDLGLPGDARGVKMRVRDAQEIDR